MARRCCKVGRSSTTSRARTGTRISLSLTSGAPIAFRYDLHTPRDVWRSDMTESGVHRQAEVSMGETSWGNEITEQPAAEKAAEGMYGRRLCWRRRVLG